MPESAFDYAHRAAEAFMAANRCEDPQRATLLREEAYRLVELIRCEEERLRTAGRLRDLSPAWGEVLAGRPSSGQ